MYRNRRILWLVVALAAVLLLPACTQVQQAAKESPAKVEQIEGSEFKRVTLTAKAAERLDVQTAVVQEVGANGSRRLTVPYAAVLYGLNGETWLYTNPESLVYVREPITILSIRDDTATLVEGPAPGTAVVTVGVAELFGAETGVSK
ncbi:MAG TPA: hypothetical protein VFR15_20815 [Chloroflexia bacterium]|nr:hypothetical protein [Chloroflexia bacterium]